MHVIKFPRRRVIVLQVYLFVVLTALLGFTEVLIRRVPKLNFQFSLECSLNKMWKDPERIPALFPNRERQNELEFVGRVHSIKKPPEVFRILCLGSSSTQGEGASNIIEYSYPAQLERILEESSPQKVEVINGGIAGAPFFMLKTHLEEVFRPMHPDLVIIYCGKNDDNLESRLLYDRMKREIVDAPFIKTKEELWAAMHLKWNPPWMIRGFLGLARLRTFMAVVLAADHLHDVPINSHAKLNQILMINPLKIKAVDECVDFCVNEGMNVVLVPEVTDIDVFKGDGIVSHSYGNIFKSIAGKFSEQNVYYKNVLDSFSPEMADSFFIDMVHMNDDGYHFLAQQLTGFLYEEGIVVWK